MLWLAGIVRRAASLEHSSKFGTIGSPVRSPSATADSLCVSTEALGVTALKPLVAPKPKPKPAAKRRRSEGEAEKSPVHLSRWLAQTLQVHLRRLYAARHSVAWVSRPTVRVLCCELVFAAL